MQSKDRMVLLKILDKIEVLEKIAKGKTKEKFLDDNILQHAAAMAFLSMGELTKHFTKDFIETEKRLPVNKMRGMRNMAAHEYDAIRFERVWETIIVDIPELKSIIEELLQS